MKRDFTEQKRMLPEFPSTPHLPWKCVGKGIQVSEKEAAVLWTSQSVIVEEKIDGSSVGMTIDDDDNPIIRNRDFILTKGYEKDTPAKNQFKPIWGWWYKHKRNFMELRLHGPYSVYGEWMLMAHGMKYDRLPSLLITYELYDFEQGFYVDPYQARSILDQCGFIVVPALHYGSLNSWEQLEKMANDPSCYTDSKREGVYVKVGDGKQITDRFKMVREDFVQGALFSDTIIKNQLIKG